MTLHPKLRLSDPFPNFEFKNEKPPYVVLDGKEWSGDSNLKGDILETRALKDSDFIKLCEGLQVKEFILTASDVTSLEPLAKCSTLERLELSWNTKITTIEPIKKLQNLTSFIIHDTYKVTDLSPLSNCKKLEYVTLVGGSHVTMRIETFQPFKYLECLKELAIQNTTVRDEDLHPLAHCKKLEKLHISNQFKTEEFAYLSVKLPNTECAKFFPIRDLGKKGTKRLKKDVMITGKRKPFLNSVEDAERIQKYIEKFEALQQKAREED